MGIRYNKKYMKMAMENRLPRLSENERIYLNVPFGAIGFAKQLNCGFDPEKKLWFTGPLNTNIINIVNHFGVNEITSERARELLNQKIDSREEASHAK